ncbi:unnamed protein product [Sphenostylis stenocarpa]|uniref:Uncharacterized protein n=1 Tax=Sphenostylis stenocarpa TaxID=92480 RepID=A0AA86V1B3_9FABA|nr:unnamed protein product [Sphenostylis stenocarpa]
MPISLFYITSCCDENSFIHTPSLQDAPKPRPSSYHSRFNLSCGSAQSSTSSTNCGILLFHLMEILPSSSKDSHTKERIGSHICPSNPDRDDGKSNVHEKIALEIQVPVIKDHDAIAPQSQVSRIRHTKWKKGLEEDYRKDQASLFLNLELTR